MKLNVLNVLVLAISFFTWSCAKNAATGGGNNNPSDNDQNIVGSDSDTDNHIGQPQSSGLAGCTAGSNAFSAVNSILQNSCVSCHGGGFATAKNALDLSSSDTVTLRGALGGVSQLQGTSSVASLVSYTTSSSHPGSGSVNVSQSDLQNTLQNWFDAELSCIGNSGSTGSSTESSNSIDPSNGNTGVTGSGTE